MSISATEENLLTLATRLGLLEADAMELVNRKVVIVSDEKPVHQALAAITGELLSRTFSHVECCRTYQSNGEDLVISVGADIGACDSPICRATVIEDGVVFDAVDHEDSLSHEPVWPLLIIAGCYLTSNSIRRLIPGIADGHSHVTRLRWSDLVPANCCGQLAQPIDIGNTVLVGAGAIGNGFVWALSGLRLRGYLEIIDYDTVSGGNLNRNVLNRREDINSPKPEVLRRHLTEPCPELVVLPRNCTFESYAESQGRDLRIERLVSAVDSRRMRRKLQSYCPLEVFDSSTNGLGDIVYHHHKYPLTGACLACIHAETPDEAARERHIAEVLGVSPQEVRRGRISETAALQIADHIPRVAWQDIVDGSYDSLFKELCAAGRLPAASSEALTPALAPLCFVSVLAGALLAMEFVLHCTGTAESDYNYWPVNPWSSPRSELKRWKDKIPNCEFCGDPSIAEAMDMIWRKADSTVV